MGSPFSLNMEWSKNQQILFFLQSAILGILLGVLFDLITGLMRNKSKAFRSCADILFGPFAAIISFLAALVIMDGQMHPLLFAGCFVGGFIEHISVGVWISKAVSFLSICVQRALGVFFSRIKKLCHLFFIAIKNRKKGEKKQENAKKTHHFFKKRLEFFSDTQ